LKIENAKSHKGHTKTFRVSLVACHGIHCGQQAAPSLRHSMPGAGTRSVESPWLAMEFIAPLFARRKYEVTLEVNA